jgi:hypothetical protein
VEREREREKVQKKYPAVDFPLNFFGISFDFVFSAGGQFPNVMITYADGLTVSVFGGRVLTAEREKRDRDGK